MGRPAKCKICGKKLDTDTAHKVVVYDKKNNAKNFYYCSEEEYNADKSKKDKAAADNKKVYGLICEIVGRKEIINSVLWKEWKEWNKVASDEVIGQYLEENKAYLVSAIGRLDDMEFNRIRYLSAVLKNKLGDFKPKVVAREVEKPNPLIRAEPKAEIDTRSDVGLRINKKKKNVRRKGFAEMED